MFATRLFVLADTYFFLSLVVLLILAQKPITNMPNNDQKRVAVRHAGKCPPKDEEAVAEWKLVGRQVIPLPLTKA